jgi:hypothetical protein
MKHSLAAFLLVVLLICVGKKVDLWLTCVTG